MRPNCDVDNSYRTVTITLTERKMKSNLRNLAIGLYSAYKLTYYTCLSGMQPSVLWAKSPYFPIGSWTS